MPNPIDVEKDLFGHIAAAHLRTGRSLRMVKRTQPAVLLYAKATQDLKYGVYKEGTTTPEIVYDTARDAVQHFLDVHKRHRVPLGDVMFADGSGGTIAVTWRHLKVRLPTLRWILKDDGVIIANILEEAVQS
jgi:hypothetical protein